MITFRHFVTSSNSSTHDLVATQTFT